MQSAFTHLRVSSVAIALEGLVADELLVADHIKLELLGTNLIVVGVNVLQTRSARTSIHDQIQVWIHAANFKAHEPVTDKVQAPDLQMKDLCNTSTLCFNAGQRVTYIVPVVDFGVVAVNITRACNTGKVVGGERRGRWCGVCRPT